ncbi:uncharacterized protein LOC135483430 [Lineus longissimus]|uniref:uncharacterized protein LOC135483430 n=1 Tax=Lineus longissimus TaxID=88925 RepID=UPI00315D42BF
MSDMNRSLIESILNVSELVTGDLCFGVQATIGINMIVTIFTNVLLVLIISRSTSLQAAPNTFLLNICYANLILAVAMAATLLTHLLQPEHYATHRIIENVSLFFKAWPNFMYLSTFTFIGYFRRRMLQTPVLTLCARKKLIHRLVWISRIHAPVMSLMVVLCVKDDLYSNIAISYSQTSYKRTTTIAWPQIIALAIEFANCAAFLISIFVLYIQLFKMSRIGKNKVLPKRTSAFRLRINRNMSSFHLDQTQPNETGRPYVFGEPLNIFSVFYTKAEQSVAFKDILEHPQQNGTRRQCSNFSRGNLTSVQAQSPQFSDISPGAQLKNYNQATLRRTLAIRRDTNTHTSALQNGFILVSIYAIFTAPAMCTCVIVLFSELTIEVMILRYIGNMLYFLLGPAYPIFYFISNKKVRRSSFKFLVYCSRRATSLFQGFTDG